MKLPRYSSAFLVSAGIWLIVFLTVAPVMSGTDVFIFRDAGWNLASSGSFVSAGLIYMHDLAPRFYAHYTPLMPLLFAGYTSIFPRNAYAGTLFNFLLGLAVAATALYFVLKQSASRIRSLTALLIVALPVLFITPDRPEALATVLFCLLLSYAARLEAHPVLIGLLLALVFLAHPFAAVISGLWVVLMLTSQRRSRGDRWLPVLGGVFVLCLTSFAVLGAVAWGYYLCDHEALRRFAAHALGFNSGLGVAISAGSKLSYLQALRKGFGTSVLTAGTTFILILCCLVAVIKTLVDLKTLKQDGIVPLAAILGSVLISLMLFPAQGNYIFFLSIAMPLGMLIARKGPGKSSGFWIALLLIAVLARIPSFAVSLLQRSEQEAGFFASTQQAKYLRSQLPADAIVAVGGGSYDIFKPEFRRLVTMPSGKDGIDYSGLDGMANCYSSFRGEGDEIRNLPDGIKIADFSLIQRAPQHLWITLFGHRVMRSQWGYGCDLYLRTHGQTVPGKF
jgi:hypothetical protein